MILLSKRVYLETDHSSIEPMIGSKSFNDKSLFSIFHTRGGIPYDQESSVTHHSRQFGAAFSLNPVPFSSGIYPGRLRAAREGRSCKRAARLNSLSHSNYSWSQSHIMMFSPEIPTGRHPPDSLLMTPATPGFPSPFATFPAMWMPDWTQLVSYTVFIKIGSVL